MSTATNPAAPIPCACCKTIEWCVRRNGRIDRYRGERFGFDGMICHTCRNRMARHQKAAAAGREPGKFGTPVRSKKPRRRARLRGEWVPEPEPETIAPLAATEIAARLRAVQETQLQLGIRPRTGDTLAELQQKRWAAKARAERLFAIADRHHAMRRR